MPIRLLPRSLFTFAVMVPATAGYAAAIWALASRRPDSPGIERMVRSWGRLWFRVTGATLTVAGREHIVPDTSYVIVSNHLSAFDIFSHFVALPMPIRYLAKKELFRIPIFGGALRAIGIVEVDRQAGGLAHAHINTSAADAIARGRSLIIYPEGTRARDGLTRPFKKGAFTIAASMGLPVLPTAITGSRDVWRPGSIVIRPGPIHVEIFPPVTTEGPVDVDDLRESIHHGITEWVDGSPERHQS